MLRRKFFGNLIAGSTLAPMAAPTQPSVGQATEKPFLERAVPGQPHKGKVLLAVEAHADDISQI
ncbi:MAG TPA: hypothetical protein VGW37_00350, partial [Terriglobia bacterium]|nr:hypothetical protein [Terriglobia bacterium]